MNLALSLLTIVNRGEQTALALEKHLEELEKKIDALLETVEVTGDKLDIEWPGSDHTAATHQRPT